MKKLHFILLVIFVCAFVHSSVFANDVTLAWEKPDDNRVVGYHIYYGTDWRSFISPMITIDSADQTSVLITGLAENTRYDFGATSVADNGNESDMSEILSYFVMGYKPGKITITIAE